MRMQLYIVVSLILLGSTLQAAEELTLEQIKASAANRSKYLSTDFQLASNAPGKADLKTFREVVEPLLKTACYKCHGSETAEGELRVDTLNPDLLHGEDTDWWLEALGAITNGEMPPEDGPELGDDDRNKIIKWLSSEAQRASQVSKAETKHTSFRRMTRYEYNYAMQDLLGLELDFAKDLPPDPVSEDGFKNSSGMLRMSASQYADYLQLNRAALNRATVRGKRPQLLYWGVSAERASAEKFKKKSGSDDRPAQNRGKQRGGTNRRGDRDNQGAHYKNTQTGQTVPATWTFRRAVDAWAPTLTRPSVPGRSEYIAVVPVGERIVIDLGNQLPDEGTLRVRIRASRVSSDARLAPTVALEFGWQGHNNSKASFKISSRDITVDATPGEPEFYQWDIPLSEIYPRNPVRKTVELGATKLTNPSEYIRLANTSVSKAADLQFDYIEVTAPFYEQWPPASHARIFIDSQNTGEEQAYAREIVSDFMKRAWRRSVTGKEVDRKMEFFARIRPVCEDFQQAVIEVLATVLSSPRFLYLVQSEPKGEEADRTLNDFELATRLSMFLWCSTPDEELLNLAAKHQLSETGELARQVKRMLADPRHKRFSQQFVRQWLRMEPLDYLRVDRSAYPQFDSNLKEAMQQEPVAFFKEVLRSNHSVIDFIHADYAMVNQRLAQHYGISDVYGSRFQKVSLKPGDKRGGLLTQAGLLAMNSDGKDSHPLKRGIWLLENILNDPPPPPPPAVPEIDLADPEILKLTLKERMEDHRNKAACNSCHVKIDPWGIAFENFDAIGSWRTQIEGKEVDASSLLFNQQKLDGAGGVKRYLLSNRQDQFVRAMAHKMTTFALGRPLNFGDRASVDRIAADLRKEGDGLATLVTLIVTSDIFKSR